MEEQNHYVQPKPQKERDANGRWQKGNKTSLLPRYTSRNTIAFTREELAGALHDAVSPSEITALLRYAFECAWLPEISHAERRAYMNIVFDRVIGKPKQSMEIQQE